MISMNLCLLVGLSVDYIVVMYVIYASLWQDQDGSSDIRYIHRYDRIKVVVVMYVTYSIVTGSREHYYISSDVRYIHH